MKSKFIPLLICLLLSACASVQETGITRGQAIAIAKRACPEYPDLFSYVDKAEWIPEKGFWAVMLADRSGDRGRVYKIDRNGVIVAKRDIDVQHPVGYYDRGPYVAPGPYYVAPPPPVYVGVYSGHPYHGRWWY